MCVSELHYHVQEDGQITSTLHSVLFINKQQETAMYIMPWISLNFYVFGYQNCFQDITRRKISYDHNVTKHLNVETNIY